MKMFKIMSSGTPCTIKEVPFAYAVQHDVQAQRNHMQTIERLNERGGLDPVEFFAVVHGLDCYLARNKYGLDHCIKWLENEFGLMKQVADAKEIMTALLLNNHVYDGEFLKSEEYQENDYVKRAKLFIGVD